MKLQLAAETPDPANFRKFFSWLLTHPRKRLSQYIDFHLRKTNLHPNAHVCGEASFEILQFAYRTELMEWITANESEKSRRIELMKLYDSLSPADKSYAVPATVSESMKFKSGTSSVDFTTLHMYRQALDLALRMEALTLIREHLGD